MNSKTPKSNADWLPCESGAIGAAASSVRARKNIASRRQFLRVATSASVVAVGVGFAGWSLFGQKNELNALHNNPNYPGGIACSEVKRLMTDYISKSLTDAALVESIDVHLTKCGHCCEIHHEKVAQIDVA